MYFSTSYCSGDQRQDHLQASLLMTLKMTLKRRVLTSWRLDDSFSAALKCGKGVTWSNASCTSIAFWLILHNDLPLSISSDVGTLWSKKSRKWEMKEFYIIWTKTKYKPWNPNVCKLLLLLNVCWSARVSLLDCNLSSTGSLRIDGWLFAENTGINELYWSSGIYNQLEEC